ncbi:MAG: ABC transporter ATP-binding protein, partial [Sphaerochaetaceae bacterium]
MNNSNFCLIENLSFGFEKSNNIIENLSLSVEEGSLTLLTGRNGSGKSILLRLIKGLLQPTKGSIIIEGEDLTNHPNRRNKKVALVFQDADIQIVGQTVKKDLLFGLENLQMPLEEQNKRLDYIATLLNLTALMDKRPRLLSGGEKRRLSIAASLVMYPKIVMLDEPFANLDYEGVKQVLNSLLVLQKAKTTIIVATHEIEK